ncbi:glycosyl hydrolase family 18 protein [Microbacterium caowuchunii]|nr:glycosyl hydrolase family 18 protein [Microbacterium caowuchunii]
MTDVSIFGWFVNAAGELSLTFDPDQLLPYREKWPHLRFWLAFRNDGNQAIFQALLDRPASSARLVQRLGEELDKYPWLSGIDIDLERGGPARNAVPAEDLFRRIAEVAHVRGLECAAALPPLTIDGSVGGEDWVRYKQLGQILDHLAIMSYDFAWSGSAPGPVSPGFWMKNVYDWVTSQVDPSKLMMGLPLYSYFWQIHNYPSALGLTHRGASGTYYAAWQYFTGYTAADGSDGSGNLRRIGWLAFREPDSASAWGLLGVYDWRHAYDFDAGTAVGISRMVYDGKPYTVRYGKPSGTPMWSVADNSGLNTGATYTLTPRRVRDVAGNLVAPKRGYTLTIELLKRYPVAATILDDNTGTEGQLEQVYRTVAGWWGRWEGAGGYSQYRGNGQLNLANDFTNKALYLQVRGQFAGEGWAGVTVRGVTAEAHPSGRVRVRVGPNVLAETSVASRPVGAAAGSGRFHLGLRVREGSARVYYALTDTNELPRVLHVGVTPSGGTAGIVADNTFWVDRVYVGDGWYYQPREQVVVAAGGQQWTFGFLPRTGIQWFGNTFRPVADVDEWETRSAGYSLDWVYEHWTFAPLEADKPQQVQVRALDHDVWVGRVFACDVDGASIAYWSDADTVVHWRDRAVNDWGLSGIALWTLGQEDMRTWDALAGGELSAETKRLNI